MKRQIYTSTEFDRLTPEVQKIVNQIRNKYDLRLVTPQEEYVLRGDSFIFKVNDHNVYRVIVDTHTSELYLYAIAVAYYFRGEEYYDEACDYKDAKISYDDMFDTIVKWVNECEADNPNFTEYERDY